MVTRVASVSAPYSVIGVEPEIETTPRYVPGFTRMYRRVDPEAAAVSAACTVVCVPLPSAATVKLGVKELALPRPGVGSQASGPDAKYFAIV
jgi:hypothetical protein